MKETITPLHYISSKGKNRRIDIILYKCKKGEFVFRVITKCLISFKDRNITITDNIYTVESFILISELMELFIESPEVNKLIHRFKDVETLKSTGNIYLKS